MLATVLVWMAWIELGVILVISPVLFLWFASDEPPWVLGLSLYAIISTALDRISSSRTHEAITKEE